MADMYHNSDQEIGSATHKIRKKFRDTMNEIEYQGQGIQNVEAFLINTEDMYKLRMLFNNGSQVPNAGVDKDGQVKMYGVKIIESHYVPEGTIFKVFKNQDQMQYPVSPISGAIDVSAMGQPGSTLIPNLGFLKEKIEDSVTTTSVNADDITTANIKEHMEKAIEAVNKAIDEPISPGVEAPTIPGPRVIETQDKKETEPVDTRHSTKRRIELDE